MNLDTPFKKGRKKAFTIELGFTIERKETEDHEKAKSLWFLE